MGDIRMVTASQGEIALGGSTIEAFASRLEGDLLRPETSGYDEARQVWNGMVDKRPALIARCASTADVVAAVGFAREHDVLFSVRGGGHNIAGKALVDGGLTIDLTRMGTVRVDVEEQTARVGGGTLLGDLDRATQAFALATTAGVVPHTGVGGLTLGGGVGRLARKHGLACDNLLGVEIVTAAGVVTRASADENEDLFWGVRGGGGNFGIVTEFGFRLHPVGPEVLGGVVAWPFPEAAACLAFYREFSGAAPDELSADAAFLFSPDEHPVFGVSICYVGDSGEGGRVLDPLRRFGKPVLDDIGPMAYLDVQAAGDEIFPIGPRFTWKSHFLTEIADETIEACVDAFARAPTPRSVLLFQQYGGAVSRVAPSETAFFHRPAQYDVFAAAIGTDPAEDEAHRAWVQGWWDAVAPFGSGGVYVNNLGEEGEDRVRAAYGDNLERLRALKTDYDPDNVFRLNANIRPTG